MNKINVSLSASGIGKAINTLQRFKAEMQGKVNLLTERLAEMGVEIARIEFSNAQYDGENDVTVSFEHRDENRVAIIAEGSAVLFIEFGTGIVYADNHPNSAENGMIRGSYGKGRGNQETWGYYGKPGTNGKMVKSNDKGDLILTHGNPANMSMYNTEKTLEARFAQIVKEVF